MNTNKKIVVKIGTNLLTKANFQLNKKFIGEIAAEIIEIKKQGYKIILVSSGAVAAGRSELPFKQCLAAVGQGILINTYRDIFKKAKIPVAQLLLTNMDFFHKKNFLNTGNTLEYLLKLNALPIVNENDVTSFDELKFGDNDTLSAKVASMIGADLLILLTDVQGLYSANPRTNPNAELIPEVKKIDDHIKKIAEDKGTKHSRGGMKSKILAAEYAGSSGVNTVIAFGKQKDVLKKIILEKKSIGTFFHAAKDKLESRKKWIIAQINKNAEIHVDEGALRALKIECKSLLPVGITEIKGEFERGDVISIFSPEKDLIGYGLTNYSSQKLNIIKKLKTEEIHQKLEHINEEEAVHRDNLIML